MLGQSVTTKEEAEQWKRKYEESLPELNAKRIARGYPPLEHTYTVVQTPQKYHFS